MHLQSLKLLCQAVQEEMHLEENTYFDLDLGVAQYPLHHVIYASTKFEVTTSYGLEDTITRKVTDGQADARTDDGPTLVRY